MLRPCRPEGVEGEARCGTLRVWEDRAARRGRRIGLSVIVLPALEPRPAEPVFVLEGGPGGAARESAPDFSRWRELRRRHDIVLVDQRGTGGSNPLHCDLYASASLAEVARDLLPPERVERCRTELSQRADLRLYTTPIAMDDLDEVRAWLGFPRIDLYGVSYGTKAAQVYLRHHGEHVRAAVLDGIVPLDDPAPLFYASIGQRAVDLLLGECAADAACGAAFPNVRHELAAVMERIDRGVDVAVVDPRSGKTERVRPNRGVVAEGIRYRLYGEHAGKLPASVHQAFQGDLAPLVTVGLKARLSIAQAIDLGAFLSATCAEEVPFIPAGAVARETAGTLLGDFRVREQQRACAHWPRGTVAGEDRTPVRSAVPALLFSGERDPVTPPAFGDRVAAGLSNSLHLVAPHSGHGTGGACTQGLIVDFLDSGSLAGLDAACLRTTPKPVFAIDQAQSL